MSRFACADCGDELEQDQVKCPACGSSDRLMETPEIGHGIDVSTRLHKWCGRLGVVSPNRKLYSDVVRNPVRRRREYRIMVIDRENYRYLEEWYNLETGKLIWWKEGRLGDPGIYGRSTSHHISDS
jgi:hypothetical protein